MDVYIEGILRLATIHTHIHAPTAETESTAQGGVNRAGRQPARQEQLG